MFSVRQKREIADAVHRILRDTEHPELPPRGQPIRFLLHVDGAESWSWADIRNNEAVTTPGVNPWNEKQDRGAPRAETPPRDIEKKIQRALIACMLYFSGDRDYTYAIDALKRLAGLPSAPPEPK